MNSHRAVLAIVPVLLLAPAAGFQATAAPAKAPHSTAAVARPHASVLPFLENDYSKAVATARARKVPIFVEAWAPW